MNRFASLIACSVWPALAFAQTENQKEAPPPKVTKVIHVQYASPKTVAELVGGGGSVVVMGDNGLKAVVVEGRADNVAAAEQAIKQLDTPPASMSARDIEVTVYILGATSKAETGMRATKEIEPVIKQLEGIFPYGSYQLLDTMLIRSREGKQASTKGMMKSFAMGQDSTSRTYSIVYSTEAASAEGNHAVRFERFMFYANERDKPDVGFDTDFDVHPGQKVVVGKTNVEGGESALFVVLTARSLE